MPSRLDRLVHDARGPLNTISVNAEVARLLIQKSAPPEGILTAMQLPLLVQSFLDNLNRENNTGYTIEAGDMERLMAYDWPGNVRELRHSVHRAYILTPPDAEHLSVPDTFASPFSRKNAPSQQPMSLVGRTIEEVERELITETLKQFDNNKTRAAEVLGVSVKTLYNRLGSYEAENAQQT